ncbi:MAG: hypothetical protein IJB21_01105 [Bacilli bacterium]|nr:hypothetical protein [Bacilli bacterium]
MKDLNSSFGVIYIFSGKLLWISGPIISLFWLIESIYEKASLRQYLGVLFLFVIVETIGTLIYLRGRALVKKQNNKND